MAASLIARLVGTGIKSSSKIFFKNYKEFYQTAGKNPKLFDEFVNETLTKNKIKKTDYIPANKIKKIFKIGGGNDTFNRFMRGKSTTKNIGEFKSDKIGMVGPTGKGSTARKPNYEIKDAVNKFKQYGINRKASADASRIKNYEERAFGKGQFIQAKLGEKAAAPSRIWNDLFKSHQKGGRYEIDMDHFATLSRADRQKILPMLNKENKWTTADQRKLQFRDKLTGESFGYNKLEKVMDAREGKGAYKKLVKELSDQDELTQMQVGKTKLNALLTKNIDKSIQGRQSFLARHHTQGVAENPFRTQLTLASSNADEVGITNNFMKALAKARGPGEQRAIIKEYSDALTGKGIGVEKGFFNFGNVDGLKKSELAMAGAKELKLGRSVRPAVNKVLETNPDFKLGGRVGYKQGKRVDGKDIEDEVNTALEEDGEILTQKEAIDRIIDRMFNSYEIGGIVGKDSGFSVGGGSGFRLDNIGNNEIGTIQSMLAGIGAGIIDIPKGAFSLGASLIDLGLKTSHAAKVEKFFDNLTTLDEQAEATTAGNLTRIITNLGIPGTQAFKIGSQLTKQAMVAKKANTYFKLNDRKIEARMKDALNAKGRLLTTAGGAAGIGVSDAIFVGDPEQVGTIGDMFGGGPTALTPNDDDNAAREVMNRMKFGLDSSLFAGILGGTGSAIKTAVKRSGDREYANTGLDFILSKFRPRGSKPQEFFDLERGQLGIRQADVNRAQEIQRGVDKHIDAIFPQLKNTFNVTTQKTRSKLLKDLNETLLSGKADIDGKTGTFKFGEMDPKLVARDRARLVELGAKDPKAIFNSFYDMRAEWDSMFTALGKRMDPKLRKDFGNSFGEKMADYLGSTYQIFQNKSLIPISNFKPGREAIDKAVVLFKDAAKKSGKNLTDEEAEHYVNNVVKTATPPRGLSTSSEQTAGIMFRAPDFVLNLFDINKTVLSELEFKGIVPISKLNKESKKVIENLLGKIEDPTQTILGGTSRLSMITRRNEFFDDLVSSSTEAQKAGKRGFFYDDELEAIAAFGRDNVKKVNMDPSKRLEAGVTNPINGKFAHKGVADALEETSKDILGEGALNSVYSNFILYPKAASQLAKTVLSPVTHFRNFISAGAFAAGNGIIPNVDAFQTAYKSLQVPGARIDNERYRDLLRLGVVNSNVRLGDLQRLLSDVQFGASASTIPGLRRLAKQGSRLKKGAEEFYTAEDDFWKITSFAMERQRYAQAYKKAGILKSADELDEIAADIVRNNIPNYDYVNDFVKGLRKFPIGNFVSFPAEIMRTSGNILNRAFKEINFKHTLADGRVIKPLSSIGYKRLLGFGATAVAIPTGVTAAAQAIYDVSGAEMGALRRFVPDWSKNSTLVPIKDEDGNLKYIDFSHANAYDTMIRPFITMKNAIQDGSENEEPVMQSVFKGLYEGIGETLSPFVSEAIWTQAATDIFLRGGRTKTGQRLYTDQTPFGEKASIIAGHLVETQLPGSIGTFKRLGLAATSNPDEDGREYELTDEALGFMGMRAVKVNPINAMKFKIADYTAGINNSRREFTRPLLRGGPVTPEQIIDRYMVANEQLFKVQQEMNKDYYAARLLGSGQSNLDREFKDRVSGKALNAIKRGQFKPFIPSENIVKSFAENARALGQQNPYNAARATINRLARQYNKTNMMVEPFPFNTNPFTAENTSLPTAGMGDTNVSLPNLGLTLQGSNLIGGGTNNTLQKGQTVFGSNDPIFGS